MKQPIGVFDSGYGGLTILKAIKKILPQYDYIYLGDNARTPYGTRSYETVYKYTLEAVNVLFGFGCHLIILACNTASAKALRTIQQNDLPRIDPAKRVLGVIRPTVEMVHTVTQTGHIGVLGTTGTVASNSYPLEIEKLYPQLKVFQEACPMWVPLVENQEFDNAGSRYFINKCICNLMQQSANIDAIILGCTHYPLLLDSILQVTGDAINVIAQDEIVANSLKDYLQRHPEIEVNCSKGGQIKFYTTDSTTLFNQRAMLFFKAAVRSEMISF